MAYVCYKALDVKLSDYYSARLGNCGNAGCSQAVGCVHCTVITFVNANTSKSESVLIAFIVPLSVEMHL